MCVLECPSQRLDLSLIEMLWKDLKRAIHSIHSKLKTVWYKNKASQHNKSPSDSIKTNTVAALSNHFVFAKQPVASSNW